MTYYVSSGTLNSTNPTQLILYLVIIPNAQEYQQQHIIIMNQVNPWWFLYYLASKSREKDAPVLLWLWFYWVAGLWGGGTGRKPAPGACFFSPVRGADTPIIPTLISMFSCTLCFFLLSFALSCYRPQSYVIFEYISRVQEVVTCYSLLGE